MNELNKYCDKIFDYFLKAKDGIFEIDKLVSGERKQLFVDVVKLIIDTGFDLNHKFVIEFNSKFTKIKKFSL